MTRLEDCCYRCEDCGRVVCADEWPSPGEQRVCADCWEDVA